MRVSGAVLRELRLDLFGAPALRFRRASGGLLVILALFAATSGAPPTEKDATSESGPVVDPSSFVSFAAAIADLRKTFEDKRRLGRVCSRRRLAIAHFHWPA